MSLAAASVGLLPSTDPAGSVPLSTEDPVLVGTSVEDPEEDYLPITDPDGNTLYYRIANGVITLYTSDTALIGTSVTDGDGNVWIEDSPGHKIYQVIGTTDPTDGDDLALIAVPDAVT